MACKDFNKKYQDFLMPNASGMQIENFDVLEYLDQEFAMLIKSNPNFKFSSIKVKFGLTKIYCNSEKSIIWTKEISGILGLQDDPNFVNWMIEK